MAPRPQGSRWSQNLMVLAFVVIVALGAKPAYRQFLVQSANRACLQEAEAYATNTRRAFQVNVPRSSPPNADCRSITDVSAGGSIDTDIIATPKPPGDATIRCKINGVAHCVEV